MSAVVLRALLVGRRVVGDDRRRPSSPRKRCSRPIHSASRGEVVVDRDEVHAPAGERVQVGGQRRDEGLALARLHLGDPAEVQRGAAHDLHVEVALAEHPPAGLAHGREGLGEQVVEGVARSSSSVSALVDLLAELAGARAELVVGARSISGSSASTSGTIAWTALSCRPSPAWRILLNNPMGFQSTGARPSRLFRLRSWFRLPLSVGLRASWSFPSVAVGVPDPGAVGLSYDPHR